MRSSFSISPVVGSKAFAATCVVLATMLLGAPQAFAQSESARVPAAFDVAPIVITGVTAENGQLFAHGLVGVNPFRTTLTVGARPGIQQAGAECPVLDLQLGPINLNLLGLGVATSPICLRVTAIDGGGLLGDLLCTVANLLQRGVPLSDVLQILEAQGRLDLFRNGLTSVLNQVFDRLAGSQVSVAATCDVLNLALGPIDLNLLGLRVELEDCSGGPVTVDLTADPDGGLLGDLLCNLSQELARPDPRPRVVRALLWRIRFVVGRLIG